MKVELFSQELVKGLEQCFSSQGPAKKQRERMWESYCKLRSSNLFSRKLADHLSTTCGTRDPCPIFYQFVRDVIFEELMKCHLPEWTRERECHFPCINNIIQIYYATA